MYVCTYKVCIYIHIHVCIKICMCAHTLQVHGYMDIHMLDVDGDVCRYIYTDIDTDIDIDMEIYMDIDGER